MSYEQLICDFTNSICRSCRKYAICLDAKDNLETCDKYEEYTGTSLTEHINPKEMIEDYISKRDWRIAENANIPFSLSSLLLRISDRVIANYWLDVVYENMHINVMHNMGLVHIHDLGLLSPYCFGSDTTIKINDNVYTLAEAFESLPGKYVDDKNACTKILTDDIYRTDSIVNDSNEVVSITKYSKSNYKCVAIYLKDIDKPLVYTKSHAVVVFRDNTLMLVRADKVKPNDKLVKLKE